MYAKTSCLLTGIVFAISEFVIVYVHFLTIQEVTLVTQRFKQMKNDEGDNIYWTQNKSYLQVLFYFAWVQTYRWAAYSLFFLKCDDYLSV